MFNRGNSAAAAFRPPPSLPPPPLRRRRRHTIVAARRRRKFARRSVARTHTHRAHYSPRPQPTRDARASACHSRFKDDKTTTTTGTHHHHNQHAAIVTADRPWTNGTSTGCSGTGPCAGTRVSTSRTRWSATCKVSPGSSGRATSRTGAPRKR